MGHDWPLVGRATELIQIDALLCAEHRSVILAGAAGVGKTRLALEVLTSADKAGLATAHVSATQSTAGIPFGALAPLLPAFRHVVRGAVDDRADFLRRSAAALVERAGERRLVLLVDDAHLLDDPSAALIHQLAATDVATILATVRTGERTPDAVVAIWKDGLAERLEVPGLRAGDIDFLLQSALGAPIDPAAAALLTVRCQGNALFLRELVLGAVHDGSLRDEGGIWRLVVPLAPSDRLVELVEARLGGLTAAGQSLVEIVALGEPVGPAVIEALSTSAVAEDLERRAILTSRVDGRRLEIRLAHPLYGEVIRARTPALRTRAIARSLAEVIEASGARRRQDTLQVATLRLCGGGATPELMLAAAYSARWLYDFSLAERLARAAVQAGGGFDAALLSAQLASLQGLGEQAERDFAELTPIADNDSQRSLIALSRVDNYAFFLGRPEAALRVAEEVEPLIRDPGWRNEIAARRATLVLATTGPAAAAEVAVPLLDGAEGRTLVWACQVVSHSLNRLGRFEASSSATRRGHEAHMALTEPLDWYPSVHLFNRCEALAFSGHLKEAAALAREQHDEGLNQRSVETQGWFALQLTRVLVDQGRVRSAAFHGREAVALFRQLGRQLFVEFSLQYLAQALALGGRAREARDALRALDELGLPPTYYRGVDLLQTRAWVAAASGDLRQACQLFEEAVCTGDRIGDRVGETTALHGLARLGCAKQVADRLTERAADVSGDLAPTRAAHTRALAASDAAALAEVADAFETMGADLLAAEAAADSGATWRSVGESRKAAAGERRAATLADRCEGARTPALKVITTRARLTRREREAALLATTGRSNREIAARLYVSVRTVEGYLQRVYEKLGISSRTELPAALDPSSSLDGVRS